MSNFLDFLGVSYNCLLNRLKRFLRYSKLKCWHACVNDILYIKFFIFNPTLSSIDSEEKFSVKILSSSLI